MFDHVNEFQFPLAIEENESDTQNVGYKLSHLGYVVADVEASLSRFVKEGAKVLVAPAQETTQRVWVCLLEITGGIKIELVAPLDSTSSPIKSRLMRGGGLDHICLEVADIDQALRQEQRRGGIIVCPKVSAIVFKGRTIAFVHRRSGLIVELME